MATYSDSWVLITDHNFGQQRLDDLRRFGIGCAETVVGAPGNQNSLTFGVHCCEHCAGTGHIEYRICAYCVGYGSVLRGVEVKV